ncbi:MAG TPA: acetyl-CoA carboxylase biotin carboxyl carrier protein subunit [Opitutaceae bacterium]
MKKTLRISFNGKTYEVVAEILGETGSSSSGPAFGGPVTATAAAASAAAPLASSPARTAIAAGQGDIPSPLAGKVVSIDAKPGKPVKTGQGVITLEAMKMNTVVSAHFDGTVAVVHVNPGDSVEEGQLLMTLE